MSDEGGFGLVELLIAMALTTVGILAVVAGFSSGFGAINKAGKASTAATLADQQMENFRRMGYSAVADIAPATPVGPDGETYWIETVVDEMCPDETTPVGTPGTCTLSGGVAARPVRRATVTVRDGSATARVLITQSTTFDQSTG